ncbi:MAG: O-antigen ligase family protein, partial [Flavobacteriaceae bacterium]|nr:O-antigen ligase family protein [Flavobacteriaceae bacterium]
FAVYFFLNFQKVFLRVLFSLSLIGSIVFFSGINTSILGIGKTERLVTKGNTSIDARMVFVSRSVDLILHYPLGVGLGNWQVYANKIKPTHLLKHQYPHNLVLEIFAELGIISGILFLILLLKILFYNYKKMYLNKNNEHSFYPLLFYLQLYLMSNSFFSGSLNDSRLLFVVMAMSLIETSLILKVKKNV